MAAATHFQTVQKIYIAFYQRPADPAGLKYWADRIDVAGGDASAVVAAFANSPEAVALYGTIDATTIGSVVDKIYMALFNKAPDAAGKQFYVDGFNAGTFTPGTIALNVLNGAMGDDAVAVNNKAQVANSFTQQVDGRALTDASFGTGTSFNATYKGDTDATAARDILKNVTSNPATVLNQSQVTEEIKTKIADATDPIIGQTGGQTFTLTNSVENLTGTAGNDTFIAGSQAGLATLNAGDTLNGGAGTDTLKIYNAAGALSAANFGTANITNVENVEATLSASAQTLNVSTNAGVTNATIVGGFDGVVTAKLAQTVGLSGTIDTTVAAAAFTFVDATTPTDSANLTLNNAVLLNAAGTGNGVVIANVETLNIAATGTNVLGNLNTAAATKMVVTGAGSLNTTLTGSATKTIDASAATGNMVINNAAATAAVQSIKTGSGNDVYTTKYADLDKTDLIDLGAGTDSLRFTDSATFNNAATMARLTKVTGVEQLGLTQDAASALTVDGDFATQTSYYVSGKLATAVLTNVATGADLSFGVTDIAANATGANTVGMKLGANTLNVNLTGTAAGASVVGGVVLTAGDGLAVTGSSTINVKSMGVAGQPNNVLDLTAADNQSVVVTGSQNLTLAAKAAVGTTGFSINGSAFTGKLTVTGTTAVDLIVGGSGADVIAGGAKGDTMTGGAGADKFVVEAAKAGATLAASDADIITDFVTASDTLTLAGATTAPVLTKALAAVADFAAALAAADTALATTGTATAPTANAQQVGADTWVFISDNAGAGAEHVVKLVGVSLAGVVAADFVIA